MSSLVLTIQLLGYLILTHTQLSAWLFLRQRCPVCIVNQRNSLVGLLGRNLGAETRKSKSAGTNGREIHHQYVPFKGFNMPKSSKIIKNHQKSSETQSWKAENWWFREKGCPWLSCYIPSLLRLDSNLHTTFLGKTTAGLTWHRTWWSDPFLSSITSCILIYHLVTTNSSPWKDPPCY